MKARIKFISTLIITVILAVSILSGGFIIANANHEHDHDGINGTCTICTHIAAAENILKLLAMALALYAAAAVNKTGFTLPAKVGLVQSAVFTPVSLKVKLNN